jgi:hypothetical protein
MKTKNYLLSLLFLLCLSLQTSLCGSEQEFSCAPSLEKIYVQPSQLHIISEGIFFLNETGNLEQACGLFSDAKGIYVLKTFYTCPSCGRANRNNVCKTYGCPLEGK